MIVIYDYPEKSIRYTDVDMVREKLDRNHVLRLRNGKYITPEKGWGVHTIRLEKGWK